MATMCDFLVLSTIHTEIVLSIEEKVRGLMYEFYELKGMY